MLNTVLLLTIAMASPAGACGTHCALVHADWRARLPAQVAAIVARVEEQASPPAEAPASPRDPRHQRDLDEDRAMGQRYSEQVAKELKFSEDQAMVDRVRRIGADLATIANLTQVRVTWGDSRLNPFDYQFHVVQGDDVNAFSIPGGFIYVYEGLVNYAESDDELAGVIAHEIAHAAFRHLATLRREQGRLEAITMPLILLGLLLGGDAGAGIATTGMLTGQAIGSGWSERAEESADYGGLQYMLRSRYNPLGILTFMERLAYDDRHRANVDWGIFRTHPPSRARARALRADLESNGVQLRRSEVTTSLSVQQTVLDGGAIQLRFARVDLFTLAGPDAAARAKDVVPRLNAFFDQTPRLVEVSQFGDAVIRGQNRDLLTLTEEDAKKAGAPLRETTRIAVANIKRALYELAYRTWNAF